LNTRIKRLLNVATFIGVLAFTHILHSKTIRVAVIDTGLDSSLMNESFLCAQGHKDFTDTSLNDNDGHGTSISGLIDQHVKGQLLGEVPIKNILKSTEDYCQIIIKIFDPASNKSTIETTVKAFEYAMSLKVDYINYSAGGLEYSFSEHMVIKKVLDAGIKVIVAAGNKSSNLNKKPFYPAKLDSRLIVVGNLNFRHQRSPTSNYGEDVDTWEIGERAVSYRTSNLVSVMTGTSQAAAIHTGKLIKKQLKSRP